MQKSKQFEQQEATKRDHYLAATAETVEVPIKSKLEASLEPVPIRPVPTYNDWIILLQDEVDTGNIAVPQGSNEFVKPEGIVIGVPAEGNGLPDGAGSRLKSQVKIGDKVMFQENAILRWTKSSPGTFYAGKRVVVVSERNLICRLRPVPFTIVNDE